MKIIIQIIKLFNLTRNISRKRLRRSLDYLNYNLYAKNIKLNNKPLEKRKELEYLNRLINRVFKDYKKRYLKNEMHRKSSLI